VGFGGREIHPALAGELMVVGAVDPQLVSEFAHGAAVLALPPIALPMSVMP
jgi:hypothetical protein